MIRRLAAAIGLVTLITCAIALPASAHVTISGAATKGGYATFSFKVPNEEDAADTTQLEVQFPTDHPLASVSVQPVPGWTATVSKTTLATPIKTDDGEVTQAVSKITWTGGAVKPGEFQQFPVSAGPMPKDADSLEFKALQTYSNGDVVRWIEDSTPGGAEPEHPAPTLQLTAATSDGMGAGSTATSKSDQLTVADLPSTVATSDDVSSARTVGIIGIVLGAIGIVAAGAVFLTRRTKTT